MGTGSWYSAVCITPLRVGSSRRQKPWDTISQYITYPYDYSSKYTYVCMCIYIYMIYVWLCIVYTQTYYLCIYIYIHIIIHIFLSSNVTMWKPNLLTITGWSWLPSVETLRRSSLWPVGDQSLWTWICLGWCTWKSPVRPVRYAAMGHCQIMQLSIWGALYRNTDTWNLKMLLKILC